MLESKTLLKGKEGGTKRFANQWRGKKIWENEGQTSQKGPEVWEPGEKKFMGVMDWGRKTGGAQIKEPGTQKQKKKKSYSTTTKIGAVRRFSGGEKEG